MINLRVSGVDVGATGIGNGANVVTGLGEFVGTVDVRIVGVLTKSAGAFVIVGVTTGALVFVFAIEIGITVEVPPLPLEP
jgi:hypothetical protein